MSRGQRKQAMSEPGQNSMIESLRIQNFTAFRDVSFQFVPGINVLVGSNASGKSHTLKLLYAMQKSQFELSVGNHELVKIVLGTFNPERPADLVRNNAQPRGARVTTYWNGAPYSFQLEVGEPTAGFYEEHADWERVTTPVFIPVKDMLAHSVGFLSLYNQRYIDFDDTQHSILLHAFLPTLRENGRKDINALLDKLAEQIEGRVEVKGERFYINGDKGRFEMHLVAEGWRKIALLYQLIANGSIAPGSVLYWDEPEANLNPSLMDEVVWVLLELSRIGVQIFLATHSYIILKELDLQKQEQDSLRMFAMARNEKDGSVTVHPAETYIQLQPNLIAEQFERIYDMEVRRALGKR